MLTDEFVNRATKVHDDKYLYSNLPSNIKLDGSKGIFICPVHGEFTQSYVKHLYGKQGCRKCSYKNRNRLLLSLQEVERRGREVHGFTYDYLYYKSPNITLRCKEHGIFIQRAHSHFYGHGCPKCGNAHKKTLEEFVVDANKVHDNKYSYEQTDYHSNKLNIKVRCKYHGLFIIQPLNHLQGHGCPACTRTRRAYDFEIFEQEAYKVHGKSYTYEPVVMDGLKTPVVANCLVHGKWLINSPANHLRGDQAGCPKCQTTISTQHQTVLTWLEGETVLINDRNLLSGKELDIYLPKYKIGIEINGLYWHSSKHKLKNYHRDKLELARDAGITLLQFWDYEVREKPEIVKSMILSRMGRSKTIVYGRKTEVVQLTQSDYSEFLCNNHLQGGIHSKLRLGLTCDSALVAVIGVSKRDKNAHHIDRFCTKVNYSVIGAFSKLLSRITVRPLVSFSDNRYSSGNVYKKCGFVYTSENKFTLYYTDGPHLYGRQTFMRHKLEKKFKAQYDSSMTAKEICAIHNFYQVWGPGTIKWTLPT